MNREEAINRLRTKAIKSAMAQAAALMEGTGTKVGAILSIEQNEAETQKVTEAQFGNVDAPAANPTLLIPHHNIYTVGRL